MANYRGQDGSATVVAVAIDELISWALEGVNIEVIEDTVKGDDHKTYKGGLADSGTITLRAWLDYATGQQDILDYFGASPQSAGVEIVLTTDTGKTFTVTAVPQSYTVNSPEGSALVDVTMVFKASGAVVIAWA